MWSLSFLIVLLVTVGASAINEKKSCPGRSGVTLNKTTSFEIGAEKIPDGKSRKAAFLFDIECIESPHHFTKLVFNASSFECFFNVCLIHEYYDENKTFVFFTACNEEPDGALTLFTIVTFVNYTNQSSPDYADYRRVIRSYAIDVWNQTISYEDWNYDLDELRICEQNSKDVVFWLNLIAAVTVVFSLVFVVVICKRA